MYMVHTEDMNTIEILTAAVANKTNDELLSMLEVLEATKQDEAGRAITAAAADTLTGRLGIDDKIEAIMFGDDDFEGSYLDAIKLAMAA